MPAAQTRKWWRTMNLHATSSASSSCCVKDTITVSFFNMRCLFSGKSWLCPYFVRENISVSLSYSSVECNMSVLVSNRFISEKYLCKIIFQRLLSPFSDFQNYLRTQTGSTTTINVIICTVDYLLRLQVTPVLPLLANVSFVSVSLAHVNLAESMVPTFSQNQPDQYTSQTVDFFFLEVVCFHIQFQLQTYTSTLLVLAGKFWSKSHTDSNQCANHPVLFCNNDKGNKV